MKKLFFLFLLPVLCFGQVFPVKPIGEKAMWIGGVGTLSIESDPIAMASISNMIPAYDDIQTLADVTNSMVSSESNDAPFFGMLNGRPSYADVDSVGGALYVAFDGTKWVISGDFDATNSSTSFLPPVTNWYFTEGINNSIKFLSGTDAKQQTWIAGHSNEVAALQSQLDGILNSFTFLYNSGVTNPVATNYFSYTKEIPANWSRAYTVTSTGTYTGVIMTTNKYTSLTGPAEVHSYMTLTGSGGPVLSVKPEIYFSYSGGTNDAEWFGDYAGTATAITTGTNLYHWSIAFPQQTSTNATGFYIRRSFKVTARSGSSTVLTISGSTNNPSTLSFTAPSASTLDTSDLMLKSGNTTNIILGLTNSADYVKMTYSGGILTFTEAYNGVTNTYNSLNN